MPFTVIWDFDGTLLPSSPYDSEQALMLARLEMTARGKFPLKRWITRWVVEADRREWFCTRRRRRLYLGMYPWLLRGVPSGLLDDLGRNLAGAISASSRRAITGLKGKGYAMAVVSCGTADLSERVLHQAGIGDCFEWVAGNRFRFKSGKISGMDAQMVTAQDKVRVVRRLGIDPNRCAVVGDGYTDLALLDWAKTAVMMDPGSSKRHIFGAKAYHFVSTVSAAAAVIPANSPQGRRPIAAAPGFTKSKAPGL